MPRIEGHTNVSQKLVDAVIAVKKINPDYSAKQILREIDKNRKAYHANGDRLPGEGGVYKIIRDNKKEINIGQVKNRYVLSELDKNWNVGSCLKHNIPPSMVPLLIEIQKVMREPSDTAIPIELTVRQCRWIAFLYQVISANEALKNRWEPNELKSNIGIMATLYAKREQISEATGRVIDTTDLDKFFSDTENTDILKLWLEIFNPEQYEKDKEAMNTFEPLRLDVLVSILGMNGLTQNQTDMFNKWLYNQFLSQVEPDRSLKAEKKILEQHPEIQPIIDSWFKSIEANEKEGNFNG